MTKRIGWLSETRRRVHHVLEAGIGHETVPTLVNGFLVALILLNVAVFAAETVPELEAAYGDWFHAFERASLAVFTIEYALRIWSCVELPFLSQSRPLRARLAYAARPMQLIDLAAIAPAYLAVLLPIDLTALRILRLFRFLKVARYSPALQSLARVMANERGALLGALVVIVSLMLFAATGMYYLERHVQPEAFGSVPQALWWAVVTLATVGYGDVVPITTAGKAFTGMMIIVGLVVFALPVGIIATGFSQEVTRRDFVVTWRLVARVPLFAGLDAVALAEIMALLYSRTYPVGSLVVRKGDADSGLFFIATGEVVVEADHGEVRLGEGEFFGEMALLDHRVHAHTVMAASRCRLLVLEQQDFERLARRHPEIMARVREVVRRRRATTPPPSAPPTS